ncbi:MAG: pyridoxal phosphate-dependent aminotransferase [Bacteroidales bacterium]|nr:pyridoxal phosphate-dependent aminotransferase [Bacteroidales bacterium]
MEKLATRITNMAASETIAMNQKSKDLQAQGIDVINLSVGEPDFTTPDHIKKAVKKAVDDDYSFYPPVPGFPELRKAIVNKFKVQNNLEYTPDQIVVCSGAKHAIVNVLLAIIDPGDEVIIPAPYWVSYAEQVKIAEGKNVILDTTIDNDFKITPEQLKAAITEKTRAFMVCSPSNPTGSLYSKEELEGLAAVLKDHENIIIISDEIYEHINFVGKHESIAQFDYLKDRVVVVNGVSKAYAMTGYRIGYLAGPAWLAKAVVKLQGQFTTGPTAVAQIASITALNDDQTCVTRMKEAFLRRRDLIVGRLTAMEGVRCNTPDGAFYVFPDLSSFYGKSDGENKINNSIDLCLYLLDKGHIATVPGDAFGAPDCIRISFANSDENLVKAMDRLEASLAKLS